MILRLLGKEMGTPFLVEPAQGAPVSKLQLSPSVVSEGVPPARAPAPVDGMGSAASVALQKRVAVRPSHVLALTTCLRMSIILIPPPVHPLSLSLSLSLSFSVGRGGPGC